MILLMTFFLSSMIHAVEIKRPASKSDLKVYYVQINEKAKQLKTVPDDELLKEVIEDCYFAKKFDENIFCLESITEFYHYFPQTVQRIVEKNYNEKDSKFILNRLDVLRSETVSGNDPSVKD